MILPAIEVQSETQGAGTATLGQANPPAVAGSLWESFSAAFGASLRETTETPRVETGPKSDAATGAEAGKISSAVDGKARNAQATAGDAAKTVRSLAEAESGPEIRGAGTVLGGKGLAGLIAGGLGKPGAIARSHALLKDKQIVESGEGDVLAASSGAKGGGVAAEPTDASESNGKANEAAIQQGGLVAPLVRGSEVGSAVADGLTVAAKNQKGASAAEVQTDLEAANPANQGGLAVAATVLLGSAAGAKVSGAKGSALLDAAEKNGKYLPDGGKLGGADALGVTIAPVPSEGAAVQENAVAEAQPGIGAVTDAQTAGQAREALVAGAQTLVAEAKSSVAPNPVSKAANAGSKAAGAKSLASIIEAAALTSKAGGAKPDAVETVNAAVSAAGAGGTRISAALSSGILGGDGQPVAVLAPPQADLAGVLAEGVSRPVSRRSLPGSDQTSNLTANAIADRLAISGLEPGAASRATQKSEAQEAAGAKAKPEGVGSTDASGSVPAAEHVAVAAVATGSAGVGVPVLPPHTPPLPVSPNAIAPGARGRAAQAASQGTSRQTAETSARGRVPVAAESTAGAKIAIEGVTASPTGRPSVETARDGEPKQAAQTAVAGQVGVREGANPVLNSAASSTQTTAAGSVGSAPLVEATVGAANHAPSVPVAAVNTGGLSPLSAGTTPHGFAVPGGQGVAGVTGTSVAAGAGGISQALSGGVAGAGRAETVAVAEPHRTIVATPTTLEVGVPDGTQGWLRIRAQVGEQGQVNASLAAGSSVGQETLHRELPALNAYLHNEQMPVTATVAERSFAAAGGLTGSADDAGRGTAANAGSAHGGTEGGGQQGDAGGRESGQGIVDRTDARDLVRSYNGSGGLSDGGLVSLANSGANSGAEGVVGRWLNVRA